MKPSADPFTCPEAFESVHRLMQGGVADGVFPGAVLLASCRGRIAFHGHYGVSDVATRRPTTPDTVFDLASLTKPLATTLAVMKLVETGVIALDSTVGEVLTLFKGNDKAAVTVSHLLAHRSGLPDYRPYFEALRSLPLPERSAARMDLLLREPLVHPVGEATLYSDLGFMILFEMIRTVCGVRPDRLLAGHVYGPLNLAAGLFFVDCRDPLPERPFAATEKCPWRGRVLCGEVHDDNAWVMGGIDGHAGLFGTAAAVHTLLCELLAAYHGETGAGVFPNRLVRRFLQRPGGEGRALGFDVPAADVSSSGLFFPRNSVGHLGFTGTSFWIDLSRRITVILLTNRVHPSRENVRIRAFRPQLHDAVMTVFGC